MVTGKEFVVLAFACACAFVVGAVVSLLFQMEAHLAHIEQLLRVRPL